VGSIVVRKAILELAETPRPGHLAERRLLLPIGHDAAGPLLLDVEAVGGKTALQLLP
jgi:hypothetical protein